MAVLMGATCVLARERLEAGRTLVFSARLGLRLGAGPLRGFEQPAHDRDPNAKNRHLFGAVTLPKINGCTGEASASSDTGW